MERTWMKWNSHGAKYGAHLDENGADLVRDQTWWNWFDQTWWNWCEMEQHLDEMEQTWCTWSSNGADLVHLDEMEQQWCTWMKWSRLGARSDLVDLVRDQTWWNWCEIRLGSLGALG